MSHEKAAALLCIVIAAGAIGGLIAASIGHRGQK